MAVYAGALWRNGEPREAWARVERGRLVEGGDGAPRVAATPAVILDGLTDFHCHVADAFLRGQPLPRSLPALVAPGHGLKHRMLAATPRPIVRDAMRDRLVAQHRAGTAAALDFREQGAAGVRLLREAQRSAPGLRVLAFGRPEHVPALPPEELDELFAVADGVGVPSLADWGRIACEEIASATHRRGLPLALHASEARTEPIDDVIALEPELLVHLTAASPADLRAVADAGIPVALCPTSNAFFGLRPPAAALERLGAPWFLGTDNAMLGADDLVAEARRLHEAEPGIPDASILRALTTRPGKAISRIGLRDEDASPAPRLVVLAVDAAGRVAWNGPVTVVER